MSKEPEGFEEFWNNDFSFKSTPWNKYHDCAKQAWLKCAERKDKEIEALKAENATLQNENLYFEKNLRATETELIKVANYVGVAIMPSDSPRHLANQIIRYLKNDR